MASITFEIKEYCGKLSERDSGWSKELNVVSWNERDPKYDLRDWAPNHERMGRGVTFSLDELNELKRLLNQLPM